LPIQPDWYALDQAVDLRVVVLFSGRHIMSPMTLGQAIERLEVHYGKPEPPEVTDPWEMIVWENIAYLADDKRRLEAMTMLRTRVGTSPEQILAAPPDRLLAVGRHGVLAENTLAKLRRGAEIAVREFGGDLRPILKLPVAQARKALKRFPAIGDPGAEKILLFGHALPILALESNGLRVLLRLGFGEEKPNYSTTYRLVQEAIEEDLVKDYPWLIKAHQLLRRHGQELCRRSKPRCDRCPLVTECPWAAANPS
jgi:endonuclease-3